MRRVKITALAAVAVLAATAVEAHHSFAALFDSKKSISVRGRVVEFEFKAPHSYIELEAVSDDTAAAVTWQVETATPGMLIRQGVTPETIRPGDTITVRGNPTRDGRRLIRLTTLTLADGTELKLQ